MYKHVTLKSLILMECRSADVIFEGMDEFDLGCNNKSL